MKNLMVAIGFAIVCIGCNSISGEYCDKTNTLCLEFMAGNEVLITISGKDVDGKPFNKSLIEKFTVNNEKIMIPLKGEEILVLRRDGDKLVTPGGSAFIKK